MQATLKRNEVIHWTGFFALFILCLLALAAFAWAQVQPLDISASHGETRHISTADSIRRCIANNGPLQVWRNPYTDRKANICQLPDGVFGLQIYETFKGAQREITVFAKSKMRTLEQVLKYLQNSGYEFFK